MSKKNRFESKYICNNILASLEDENQTRLYKITNFHNKNSFKKTIILLYKKKT